MVFSTSKKFIESTHFVGWLKPIGDDHQGLWGHLHMDGTMVKVNSPGMYFIYVMIQHKSGTIKSSGSNNMTTATSGMPPVPLKVTLYKSKVMADGETHINPISQTYYSTDNRAQQNTFFARMVHLTSNDNLYLGISGYGFVHQESDSHYMGLCKI
ncbi:hypothetical protein CHS0354_002597 [Potamilus streckersoni]|uniref:THD domain-containing protein n=1 Tax=Potamilus streckersoni TaxID=2493646 RepID=A0AAE0RNV3_9BIVA|nr:hypothetical protein CHS0354_002597 [Potamilus streckersoni]